MGLRRLRLGLAMLTYQDWLLFCFVLGVLGGTAAALAFGGPVVHIPSLYALRKSVRIWRSRRSGSARAS